MIKGVHIGEWEGGRVGGGKGGREGEKYFLPYKRVLVTLVLYLLKFDGKCKQKENVYVKNIKQK